MSGEDGPNVPLQTDESSKCSVKDIRRRTLPADIRHPASNPPFSDLVSENSWNLSRTLRTCNLSFVVTFEPPSPDITAVRWMNLQYQVVAVCLLNNKAEREWLVL